MQRRDLSKVLLGTAVGVVAMAKKANAQTCVAPCYAQTAAESAAGVTPVNYAYSPDHVGADVRRYGNVDLTGAPNDLISSFRVEGGNC